MSRERERFDETGKKIRREIDAAAAATTATYNSHQMARTGNTRHNNNNNILLGGGPVAGGGGFGTSLNTITPCAACKLLRRRCAEECPFSPYFSPHEPHKFAAVHKVFGASNVSKMLMEVPEPQRADAANSLVYEANVRLRDPVYGCMGAISALQQQVQSLQAELNAVRAEILRYKYREAANTIINASNHVAAANNLVSNSVSVAVLPPPSPPPPPPPSTPPPPPSIVVSSNSSSSSLYTSTISSTGYTSIPSDSVPYF